MLADLCDGKALCAVGAALQAGDVALLVAMLTGVLSARLSLLFAHPMRALVRWWGAFCEATGASTPL